MFRVLVLAHAGAIEFPHVDLRADPSRSETVSKVLHELAPSWVQRAGGFRAEPLSGGLTNQVVRIRPETTECESMLLRIFGENTERVLDRKRELATLRALAMSKYFPHAGIVGTFHNGRLERYAPGRVLSLGEMRTQAMADKICETLAHFHGLEVPGCSKAPSLWSTLHRWLDLALADGATLPLGLDERQVRRAIDGLRARVASRPAPAAVVFCHNDASAHNLVFDAAAQRLTLIDFEYASYNYLAFELANHLFEYVGSDPTCWEQLPTAAEEGAFLTRYVRAARAAGTAAAAGSLVPTGSAADTADAACGAPADEACVRALHEEVAVFKPATHLFWGLWALVWSASGHSRGFDYRGYAVARLALAFPEPRGAATASCAAARTTMARPALALRGGATPSPPPAAELPLESTFEDYVAAAKHYDDFRVDAGMAEIESAIAEAQKKLGSERLRVLDAGCGSGNFLKGLIGMHGVGEVVGMEPNDGMRGCAERKAASLPGVSVIAGSVLEPPATLAAGSFDVVVINQMIHHLDGQTEGERGAPVSFPGAELALENVAGLLRPGGLLLVNFQDTHQIEATWYYELFKPHMLEYARTRLASRAWYDKTLARHGFRDVAFRVVTQPYFPLTAYLDRRGPSKESWRRADSAWAGMDAAEVEAALAQLEQMEASGELEGLIQSKEQLRKLIGMSTTVSAWH